jgi:hypothetical protein
MRCLLNSQLPLQLFVVLQQILDLLLEPFAHLFELFAEDGLEGVFVVVEAAAASAFGAERAL